MPQIIMELPRLKPRPTDSHKGTFGRVLVLAGSRGMAGACVLAASACLRAGAGLVRVGVPKEIQPIVAAGNPCYTTTPLPQDDHGMFAGSAIDEWLALAEGNDVVALGPGLGRSHDLSILVPLFLRHCDKPIVLDADGLVACSGPSPFPAHAGPVIITPHPGEFARLLGVERFAPEQRQDLVVRFAQEHGLVVVLKGSGTIVTDGDRVYVNHTGNPGMATGGTGDVLTGIIAALCGQGLAPFEAAQLGVHVHGLAGDQARDAVGEICLIATDVVAHLPAAFRSLTSPSREQS
jgi:NAD(P)H-hydrate epimerase